MRDFKGCMAGLLASLIPLAGCGRFGSDEEKVRQAVGDFRPVEPRLTLDTGWAPCSAVPRRTATRAGCSYEALLHTEIPVPRCSQPLPPESPEFRQLSKLARRIERQPREERDAALATVPLLLGAGETDTTATIQALKDFGRDAGALADLSAAYLHLAGLTRRPLLLLDSLEASGAALEMQPDDPRARFNRVLGLFRLNLRITARREWESYLRTAEDDAWAAEARDRLARTDGDYQKRWSEVELRLRKAARAGDVKTVTRLVADHRQRSREWAEQEILASWATGEGEAAGAALQTAGLVGDALAGVGGDRMLAEGVAAIADSDGRRLASLRNGHRELAAGHDELYRRWRLERARHHFLEARGSLSGNPYELWADFYLALVAYYQEDYARASASLETLRKRFDQRRYPVLAGRILWIEGLIAASEHHLKPSADLYRAALEIFCAGGEEENLAAVHALSSEVLNKLGRYEESWQHLYNALAKIDRIFDPIRHHALLEVAILNARRQGLNRAGLAFAEEHLPVARRTGSAQILHYAFMHRASLRHALGDLQGAKADLEQAAHAVKGLEDRSLRDRSGADFNLVNAEIQAGTDPRAAIRLLNGTIVQYQGTQYSYLLPQAYGARGRAFLSVGELKLAERDFDRQIHIYEESADEILQDVFRLSFLEQTASAFDEMIALQATRMGRPALALEYCERSRYRALLDAWTRSALEQPRELPPKTRPAPRSSFDPRGLQGELPPEVAILEFALLDEHLLSWVITRTDIKMVAQKVSRQDLAERIRRLHRGLGGKRNPSASRELYELLMRPMAKELRAVSHLVVVPDKELFKVPFEALVDRRTGRFVVEDWTVSYAPSASLHLRLREKLKRDRRRPEIALAATGAQNGGTRYEALPGAVAEAGSIASLYPRGSLLANPGKKGFLDALSHAQVLHFAGHAVPDVARPFDSKLVLADTEADHVELYAYELYDRTLPDLKLVVLSACGTADPTDAALGTAATLAGPFLAAGVPQVIGSQWRVDDDSTRLFFTAFHRRLAKGADAAAALRATKLEFLRSGDAQLASPRVWGAFVLVGG